MKNIYFLIPVLLIFANFFSSCSPTVYKTATDTVNLNKEYRVLLRDVVNLQGDINKTKSNIPVYEAKLQKANAQSKESLEESRAQASVATGGNLKQIRKSEKKADKAQDQAEEARDASKRLSASRDDLKSLQAELAQKQRRLEDLDTQRAAINASVN